MFSADNINIKENPITVQFVKSRVSDKEIFRKYCSNFETIGKAFISDLYEDNNPSCYIYSDKYGNLKYKDFGSSDHFDCFSYVMNKYNISFTDCLKKIASDFILDTNYSFNEVLSSKGDSKNKEQKEKYKIDIRIIIRQWDINDYNYWFKRYRIKFDLLNRYNIIPVKYCYLIKKDKTVVFEHNKFNPIYAYQFYNNRNTSYKIYWPLTKNKKYKFLFNGNTKRDIEGFEQLPKIGELLIITSSLKDVICLKNIGYNAISLHSETARPAKNFIDTLLNRFNKLIILYDNDKEGIKSSEIISKQYGIKNIFIPKEFKSKDVSDLIYNMGIDKSKEILNNIINE